MKTISEIFEVINGVSSSSVKIFDNKSADKVKYVRPSNNYRNTKAGYVISKNVSKEKVFEPETLFVSTDGEGSHTHAYVSTERFVPNSNVAVLLPKEPMVLAEKLYYATCITMNRYRFSYGRKPKGNRLKSILIPDKNEIPNWVYNQNLNKFGDAYKPFNSAVNPSFNIKDWRTFRLDELFELKKGKRLTKANMKPGKVPFIGAIDKDNGYRQFIGREPIHEGNTITINYNGSVAESFYQPKPFWASDDVNVLYPKFEMNQFIALFIVAIIKLEKYRFNYGRKWHLERMNSSEIDLPVKKDNRPDFEFMEEYIKKLNYSKKL